MAETDVLEIAQVGVSAVDAGGEASAGKLRKPRVTDQGPEVLPDMGQFVALVRKIKHRSLVAQWLGTFDSQALSVVEW